MSETLPKRLPASLLEAIRKRVQPHARKKKQVPVVIVDGAQAPILDTVDGRTCAVVGKEFLCGDYYD